MPKGYDSGTYQVPQKREVPLWLTSMESCEDGGAQRVCECPRVWGCMGNALVCSSPLKAKGILGATAFTKSVGLAQGHSSV